MNINSRNPNPVNQLKDFFTSKAFLPRLILCILAGGIVSFIGVVSSSGTGFYEWLANYAALPPNFLYWLRAPWTILTYAFIHFSFWNFLFNIVLLYYFGILFSQYLGQRQFGYTYFSSIVLSGGFFMLLGTLLPALFQGNPIPLSGASPAVFSILFGIAYYLPNFKIRLALFGEVKLKNLALVFAGLELLLMALDKDTMVIHMVNLFGGLVGIAGVFITRKSKGLFVKKPRKMSVTRAQSSRPLTDEQYNAQRAERQKQLDVILDKIAESGYSSLTGEEKRILFENSNK